VAKSRSELRVFDVLFDRRGHGKPCLDLDHLPVEIGEDEAVGMPIVQLASQ